MNKLYISYCSECEFESTLTEDDNDTCNNCGSNLYVLIPIEE